MSTRTVIEINHDYLADLESSGQFETLLHDLRGSSVPAALNKGEQPRYGSGIRVLGQRHHSETLKLTVK